MSTRGFIFALTWANCGWQVVFALLWHSWGQGFAAERWGEQGAALIQGAGCLGPTLIVAVIVLRWCRKAGLFS